MTLNELRQEADALTITQLTHFKDGTEIDGKKYRAVWPLAEMRQYLLDTVTQLTGRPASPVPECLLNYITTHELFGTDGKGNVLHQMPRTPVANGKHEWDMSLLQEVIREVGSNTYILKSEADALLEGEVDADS